jgi:hypothetical protein
MRKQAGLLRRALFRFIRSRFLSQETDNEIPPELLVYGWMVERVLGH